MSGCPATDSKDRRCDKDVKFPPGNPLVCGNHKYKINDDGEFDDSIKKTGPQTPEKAELEVMRAVEDEAELMRLASAVVGVAPDLLDVKTVKQKHDVVIKIAYKKPGSSPSPAVAQQMKEKDDEIERLRKMMEDAGLNPNAPQ
jgi:lipase chaperone LimK